MNENYSSWIIMSIFTLGSIAFYAYNRWTYRDMPRTREARLEEQIAAMQTDFGEQVKELRKQIAARDEQINILLDDRMRDRERIRMLELSDAEKIRRIAELEREQEMWQKRPARQGGNHTTAPTYTPDRKLNSAQKRTLRAALLDAYTTPADWRALLQDIDHGIDSAIGDNLELVIGKDIDRANSEGWGAELIREAAKQRPNLERLNKLADVLLRTLTQDSNG